MRSRNLKHLNITGLEIACSTKEYHTIPSRQIDSLAKYLIKAQQLKVSTQLGIQGGQLPQETIKILQESRKRGRRSDL